MSPPPRIFAFALVAVLLSGCSERESGPVNPEATGPEEGFVRRLELADFNEVILKVTRDSQNLSSQDAATMSGKFEAISGWNVFDGAKGSKTITERPAGQQVLADIDSLGEGGAADAFDTEPAPQLFNGVYKFTLTGLDGSCDTTIGFSHLDTGSANGNFLDVMSGDQNLNCDFNMLGTSCSCTVEGGNAGLEPHLTPSGPLDLEVSPTDAWFFAGDPVDFTVADLGDGIPGTARFAWFVCKRPNKTTPCLESSLPRSFDFAGGAKVGTSTFSTDDTFTKTFFVSELEVYDGVVIGYAGEPTIDSVGSYYSASNMFTFDILADEQLNSEVFGHNLPSTITEGTWMATNVTMRNLGSTTWSGSSYTLNKMAGPFIPSSVSMGSGSTSTMEEYTFNFNMSTEPFEPLAGSWYDNDWSVAEGGTPFGETLQWQTFVKEGSGSAFRLDATPLWAWLVPDALHASTAVPGAQEEELQRVRVEDYRLPQARVEADGRWDIRYEASLGETEWDADFSFLVEYDSAMFEVGSLERGRRGGTHLIQVAENSPGRLKVTGTRLPGRALSGEGLIFEIPPVLRDGAEAPESLPLVEVVATR